MTAEAIESRKLDIARVIEETFRLLGGNFVTYFVLSLLLYGLPNGIVAYLQLGRLTSGDYQGVLAASGYIWLLALITNAILQGAILYSVVQQLNGSPVSIGSALANGLRAFLPIIGATILLVLAIAFGLVVLIVPGLMIATAWIVVIPSLVAERTGVFGAFSRSADLTRGNRWRIFALLALWAIVAWVLNAVVTGIFTSGLTAAADAFAMVSNPLLLIVSTLLGVLLSVVATMGLAVLYVELRKIRDGAAPQWLAEIFS